MQTINNILDYFFSFKRVPVRVIVLTALLSYGLQIGTILMGQPVYVIVIVTILPWIPVFVFESMWQVKHYHWVAVLGALALLQSAHLVDFVAQTSIITFANGTPACPIPVDNYDNYALAVDEGLREPNQGATGIEVDRIAVPNENGGILLGDDGLPIYGPPACGFFGQLNLPILNLFWDFVLLIIILLVLQRFPTNGWLWFAMIVASWALIEHGVVTYLYYFASSDLIYTGSEQLWATLVNIDSGIVSAIPVGTVPTLASFYDVSGQFGILGHDGLVGTFAPALNPLLPEKLWLAFLYNTLIAIPLLLAVIWEGRRIYDFYLAEALPNLSRDELVRTTPRLERETFAKDDVIVKQGEPADDFYIISSGEVAVYFEDQDEGAEDYLATLGPGQYFGEVGLMNRSPRMATVRAQSDRVEVMKLDYTTFNSLMSNSEMSRQSVQRVIEQRVIDIQRADAE